MEPTIFIDREIELGLIRNAFDDLFNKERLLRTPIINFYGVGGIGKTSILKEAIQKCNENAIPYIDGNASQGLPLPSLLQGVSDLARKYKQQLPQQYDDKDILQQFVEHVRVLLEQGPLVMLLDAVDTTKEYHLEQLKKMLSQLDAYNNLFVVLTSRGDVSFEHAKSIARKLTPIPLKPFNRNISNLYLDNVGYALAPEVRDLIFKWTRGYPLAMHVMVNTIIEWGTFLIDEQRQKELIDVIVDKVINQSVLSKVKGDEQDRLQTVLSLLAVPRKFNLVVMKNLIERFEPDLKRPSSLAYMSLPREIFQATGTLSWDFAKAGFALDESIRNILLWQLRITNLQRYHEINSFLAEMNRSIAAEVVGSDRIYYQREYLYHSANSTEKQNMPQIVEEFVKNIGVNADDPSGQLIQFRKEFMQDAELREVLDRYATKVMELIDYNLAQNMYNFAVHEDDEEKRFRYLNDFFTYIIRVGSDTDFILELKEKMRYYLTREKAAIVLRLHEELTQREQLEGALRRDFPVLFAHFNEDTSAEG